MWSLIKIIAYFIRNLICAFVAIVGGTLGVALLTAIIGAILATPAIVIFLSMAIVSIIVICLITAIDEVK